MSGENGEGKELPPEEGDLNTESPGSLSEDEKKWLKQDLESVEAGHSSDALGYEGDDTSHWDSQREEEEEREETQRQIEERRPIIQKVIKKIREAGISEEMVDDDELHCQIEPEATPHDYKIRPVIQKTLRELSDEDEEFKNYLEEVYQDYEESSLEHLLNIKNQEGRH